MRSVRLKGPIVGLAVVAGGAGLLACGGTVIDNNKIQDGFKGKLGPNVQSISCPSGQDSKTGNSYDCTVTLTDGSKATLHSTITDGSNGQETAQSITRATGQT